MILAIDYGRANLGLAISEGKFASPYTVLSIKNPKEGKHKLVKFIEEQTQWEVDLCIVGISQNKMGEESQRWGESLAKVLKIPVKFVDENWTSIVSNGDHAKAAAFILQRYLDDMI